jgi:uncharacterized membrane protein YecN with MAPEG domain
VVSERQKQKVILGDGGSEPLRQVISAHNNFNNYVPLFLILLYLLESAFLLPWFVVAIVGTLFCIGRFLHYMAFSGKMNFKLRKLGMILTLMSMMIASLLCIAMGIRGLCLG